MIENFIQYAMRHYDNPNVTIEEFKSDCDKFQQVNKLFGRYYKNNDLNARLILNHIIILYNVFDAEACTEMLFFKTKSEYWSGLKTILTFLNYMPEQINSLLDSDIPVDIEIANELRKL